MVAQSGTGKTLAAEFGIIDCVMYEDTAVFLVPYRALAEEKERDYDIYNVSKTI